MNPGYRWRIEQQANDCSWALVSADTGLAVLEGRAPSRKVAAAYLVRAITVGIIAQMQPTATDNRLAA